jgi:hypothetical protein
MRTATILDCPRTSLPGPAGRARTDGVIRRARYYLEPVDTGSATVDEAVREQVVR